MLYGRDAERDRIGALLRAARETRSAALVIRGEPGVGKTALLEDTRERASDMHVLTAHGIESESDLPFAALHQLFHSSLAYADRLPGPQATALQAALGLTDGGAPERFLVSAACLSLLSELSERRPVLCLLDDAHWLDQASADTLLFVARRLEAEGVVMLFATREGDVRTFEARDIPSLYVGGLNAGASATLLARTVGEKLSATVVERLVEETGGNALALLELPSTLSQMQLSGGEPLPTALPLSGQVERIFLERVRRLGDVPQRFLLVAAADESGDLALIIRAAQSVGAGVDALDVAERAALVRAHGNRLAFRHPLVRSAIYGAATAAGRREAHSALADALGDKHDDRRAWHLAGSVLDRDENVAQLVEEVAERARERGGYASAARALERAAELSDDEESRVRRLALAAQAASVAGQDNRAVALAEQTLPRIRDPELRANLIDVLALAELRRGRPADGVAMLVEAARHVADADPRKAVDLLVRATSSASQGRDVSVVHEIAELAAGISARTSDARAAFIVDLLRGREASTRGDTAEAARLVQQALAWGASSDDPIDVFVGSLAAAWLGDDSGYGRLLDRTASIARERGQIGTLAEALSFRAAHFGQGQRYDEAAIAAGEALQLARELGAENYTAIPLNTFGVRAAIRGHVDEARQKCSEVLRLARAHDLPLRAGAAQWGLGLVEMGAGRWGEALDRFDGAVKDEPLIANLVAAERIEAAVRAGQHEHAAAVLSEFERWAGHTKAAWAEPRVASCRGLLAQGDEATEHFEEAVERIDQARPFDTGRIYLLYGEHLRRERRRMDARAPLREAIEAFDRLQAAPWTERASAELRATGETARKRDPSTLQELTPKEVQIARLVAAGQSNKEVAAQLYLSPRTIDYHLRNVFSKLGLTSRTQLAHAPLGEDPAVGLAAATA